MVHVYVDIVYTHTPRNFAENINRLYLIYRISDISNTICYYIYIYVTIYGIYIYLYMVEMPFC